MSEAPRTTAAPLLLVPGWWLGAWAWDDVVAALEEAGHLATALTLPGLEPSDAHRASVSLADQVDAVVAAVEAAGRPVVLAVHSGHAVTGYAASDRVPALIAAMVYVDTGPPTAAVDPDFADAEKPPPSLAQLAEDENLDGISEAQLAEFERRAVPEPGGALRDAPMLRDPARLDVPSTVICTAYSSSDYRDALDNGQEWLAGLAELHDLTWVDLPTSHWPMWSRPRDLAALLGDIATAAGERGAERRNHAQP